MVLALPDGLSTLESVSIFPPSLLVEYVPSGTISLSVFCSVPECPEDSEHFSVVVLASMTTTVVSLGSPCGPPAIVLCSSAPPVVSDSPSVHSTHLVVVVFVRSVASLISLFGPLVFSVRGVDSDTLLVQSAHSLVVVLVSLVVTVVALSEAEVLGFSESSVLG